MSASIPKAVIFGHEGLALTEEEKAFFAENNPLGFILFQRNCESPEQVRALTQELRACVGRDDAPILIDQEGGRVTRLHPPHWRKPPAGAAFAALAEQNLEQAKQAAYLNAQLIAAELTDIGITVDCVPNLDLLFPESNEAVIGDRSFGSDPEIVAALGQSMAQGLLDGGVLPVIKHIPGHGRGTLDSHDALPVVEATKQELEQADFIPFKRLSKLPWGMTAHIRYTGLDADHISTLSPTVIHIIREEIGFDGLLLTDDISMKALGGSYSERTEKSLAAGCDIVLHCNGNMEEMQEVAAITAPLTDQVQARFARGQEALQTPASFDKTAAQTELDQLLTAA